MGVAWTRAIVIEMEARGSIQEIIGSASFNDDGIDGERHREESSETVEKEQVWDGMGKKISSNFKM